MRIIADQCRYAQTVATRHGLGFEVLDDGEGYLFRISRGEKSFVAGAGPLASYPLNNALGASVARDKVYSNRMLSKAGVPNLGGRAFFFTDDARCLRGSGYELSDAVDYFLSLGSVAFCKPLTGSRGDFAELVRGREQLNDYASRCAQRYPAMVMQRLFHGAESRVFVFDGTPIFCVEKAPVEIVGDGRRSVHELIEELSERLSGTGVSPYRNESVVQTSSKSVVEGEYRPGAGERLTIMGRKNLSSGGTPRLIEPIPEVHARVAVRAAEALGLRVAAIDLMECDADGELRVIEVNSNPEITSLEHLDRWDIIERIWLGIIEECLA